MKRIVCFFLTISIILTGCGVTTTTQIPVISEDISENATQTIQQPVEETEKIEGQVLLSDDEDLTLEDYQFSGLNDPNLLQFVEDAVYANLEGAFKSDDYIIEGITTKYLSKEYLEEVEYNSRKNIYFGFSLAEIEEQFDGGKYIFTLGEDGQTEVIGFEAYDDTYDQVLKNVAIGSGVIILSVTVTAISGALGAPAISMIFAASAKSAASLAFSSGAIGALSAGIVKGFQTNDFDEALKAAALTGSNSFKWGAIGGMITGGISQAVKLHRATKAIPSPREAEMRALKKYGGQEQKSYIGGEEVPYGTPGSTRPDIVRTQSGKLEAIEVKNYDLNNETSVKKLFSEIERQVRERVDNLPVGSTQRIVVNAEGRGYTEELITSTVKTIQDICNAFYPNIPVNIMR